MKKNTHQTENSSLSTLSRRQFLQGAAATCLAASMLTACSGSDGGNDYFDSVGHDNVEPKEGVWHHSHCRMCMKGECSNQYMIVEGVVTEMKGNKASPMNKGAMCPRGHAAIQNLYNPYRIKAPMKRTNPQKGLDQDPGWVEITWEEALSTVSSKFSAIQQNDPRRMIYQTGFGDMDFMMSFMPYFGAAFGPLNAIQSNGPLCSVHFATDLTQGVMPTADSDLTECKYHITMGRSLGMGFATANGHSRGVAEAIAEGRVKIVDINPRLTPEGSKGEWVGIKPGTDLAFLLAMAHSIIYDIGKIDEDFLQWRTNAPYIIGTDGLYYRGTDDKPQIFDASDNTLKSFDDPTLTTPDIYASVDVGGQQLRASFVHIRDHLLQYTPEWAENITTISASTIRRITAEFVAAASPSGTFTETIELDDGAGGTVTAPLRPASLIVERGAINQRDGTHADLMTKVINMLIGAFEVPGGVIGAARGDFLSPDADGVVLPKGEAVGHEPSYPPQTLELTEYFIFKHSMPYLAYRAVLDPAAYGLDYNIDGLLVVGSNPIGGVTEPDVIASAIASIPFVTTIAYHYDEPAVLSDIVLPSHALLERESANLFESDFTGFTDDTLGLLIAMYRDPVPPVYNTRQPQEIIMDIAEEMGILPTLNVLISDVIGVMMGDTMVPLKTELKLNPAQRYSITEIWDRGLKTKFGDNIGVDYLKANGIHYEYEPKSECYNSLRFAKGTTRHPIYFDRLLRFGRKLDTVLTDNNVSLPNWNKAKHLELYEAMPTWRINPINDPNAGGEYNLIAFNFKITGSPFKIGAVDQMPWLHETCEAFDPYYNTICMHPSAAGGLRDGSIVTVESANGKIQGKLRLTQMVHPEAVAIGGSTGRRINTLGSKAASMTHYNMLTNGKLDNIDTIAGGVVNSVRVKVY